MRDGRRLKLRVQRGREKYPIDNSDPRLCAFRSSPEMSTRAIAGGDAEPVLEFFVGDEVSLSVAVVPEEGGRGRRTGRADYRVCY